MKADNRSRHAGVAAIGPRPTERRPRAGIARPAGLAKLLLVIASWLPLCASAIAGEDGDVLVFAAASLKPALDTVLATRQAQAVGAVQASYAASSQLARQIEHGAPASVFISADRDWMDHLDERGLIMRETRADLLGNALVLIAPADNPVVLDLAPGVDLARALGPGDRLAIAEPDSVPAGKYAKAALTSLGAWSSVEARTVRAGDVRAALNFVARGEAPLGIVYRSDARSEPRVHVVGTFPADTHAAIVYPAAIVTANDSPAARRMLALLRSEAARSVFATFGFDGPPTTRREAGDWTR